MGANDLSLMMVELRQYFENFKEMNKTSGVSAHGGVCQGGVSAQARYGRSPL